jgi:hypothetical protein
MGYAHTLTSEEIFLYDSAASVCVFPSHEMDSDYFGLGNENPPKGFPKAELMG